MAEASKTFSVDTVALATLQKAEERVARHVQKSYLSPKVGQLRSVKASKFVVVELLNDGLEVLFASNGSVLRKHVDGFEPAEIDALRAVCLDDTIIKVVPRGLLKTVAFFASHYKWALVNVVCLEIACDPRFGLAFLKEQYVLLEDVYYSVGLKAYIDRIITLTADLISEISSTAYWCLLGTEVARLCQTLPCTLAGQTYHLSLFQLALISHAKLATTLTDADILNEVVLGTLAKSAKNTYSKIWKELEPTFASRFLYDQELLCDELPQYPPFYHEAFPAEHWSLLDEHLSDLVTSASFSEAEAQTYDKIRSDLQEIVAGMKVQAEVLAFGSTVTGLGFNNGDLDLCLVSDADLNAKKLLRSLSGALKSDSSGLTTSSIVMIAHAKVPIVKFKVHVSKSKAIACDLSVGNTLALHNSQLLKTYRLLDRRVAPLILAVKRWAARREIHDASKGNLSSYALTLMVVHYLQRSRVLPYLQSPLAGLPDLVPVLVDEWNVAFHSDVDLLFANGHAGSDNLVTAAQLLVGFFHYFAFEFDFQNHIVCIREDKQVFRKNSGFSEPLVVKDPFLLSRNTSGGVKIDKARDIMNEFVAAYETLIENAPSDQLVCLFDNSDLK